MDMRVGLYPLTGEPGCGSGGTGTAWKSGNSGSRLQAVYNQGHASVVVLLLADERLDPNIANQDGSRALTRAALNRYDSVVKLLLADERLDPNIADKSGITALWGTWGVGRRAAPWSRLATSIESKKNSAHLHHL